MTHAEQQAAAHKARIARMWGAAPAVPVAPPEPRQPVVAKKIVHIPIRCDEDVIEELRKELWFRDHPPATIPRNVVKIIKKVVATKYRVTAALIDSDSRDGWIVKPRHIAMYLAKELTKMSYPDLGRKFGGRDHTTIIHAHRKYLKLIAECPAIAAEISAITQIINGTTKRGI